MKKNAVTHKYLAFSLGGEFFGAPVLHVCEIVRLVPITPVPQMPDYVKGVINLRGRIITVVDMRVRLGTHISPNSERHCIVVCQIEDSNKPGSFVGVIVDTVDEVMSIKPEEIQERLTMNVSHNADYVLGMTHSGGHVRTIMDMQLFLQHLTNISTPVNNPVLIATVSSPNAAIKVVASQVNEDVS